MDSELEALKYRIECVMHIKEKLNDLMPQAKEQGSLRNKKLIKKKNSCYSAMKGPFALCE